MILNLCNSVKKLLALVVLLSLVLVLMPNGFATTMPRYEVILEMSNHNIEKASDRTILETNVIGVGRCDSGHLGITSEIPLVLESSEGNGALLNAHSLYESDLKESGNTFVKYCIDQRCSDVMPSRVMSALTIDTDLNKSLFTTPENRIRLKLEATCPVCVEAGGEYEINAFFICRIGTESFFFTDSTNLRVRYDQESSQYTFSFWAFVISLVAIILTVLKEFILPAVFRPRLSLEAENDDECIENSRDSRWLRLRLINKDFIYTTSAKGCYVKLLAIKNLTTDKLVRPFNSFPLRWVLYNSHKEDLAVGEHHLLDLVFEYSNQRKLLMNNDKYPLPHDLNMAIKRGEEFGPGRYLFTIAVYGDNFASITKKVKVKLTEKFGELRYLK